MTRKPVFTKKGGTELYTYYMISYGKIIDSSNSLSEIKRKAEKHAKLKGDSTKIVKLEGEYIPIWW